MKILFPIETLCKGGGQRMLAEIMNGLTINGHDVTILMPPSGKILYPTNAKLIRTQKDTIEESDFPISDIIVSNFYTTVSSAHAASLNGKGMHIRFSLCYEPPFLQNNDLSFLTYNLTPNIIVLSKSQQKIIHLIHGIKGHIVPVGISSTFVNMNIREPNTPLQISAIVRNPDIGFTWHREQDYLISELAMVKSTYPNIIINLITPPDEFYNSPTLQRIKATHSFRWFTPADDIELCYHYNQTDIFVNSSIFDSASLPGLEAMKCGATLVTTYNGGNVDYCRHEENALISYRYQNRLGSDILRLIQNPSLRTQLATSGEREATKWTWEKSTTAFEKALQQIMTH